MTFIDCFGQTVTGNSDGTWTRGGVTVGPCFQAQAEHILAGMAPEGWVFSPTGAAIYGPSSMSESPP
jgi:hypothetical protein